MLDKRSTDKLRDKALALTDRCVMCGLCSTHCPTYQLTQTENESPRGRISLIQAWLRGQIEDSDSFEQHMESCLQCRTCERVCPSGVKYGELADASSALRAHRKSRSVIARVGRTRIKRLNPIPASFVWWMRVAQRTGLLRLAKILRLTRLLGVDKMLGLLPSIPKRQRWHREYPAHLEKHGQVALFTGCASNLLDNQTLAATIRLLNRHGLSVTVPPEQVCCGALALHNGELEIAEKCAEKNVTVFSALNVRAVLSVASGCSATLQEYEKLDVFTPPGENRLARFRSKPQDIVTFLLQTQKERPLPYAPLRKRVAVFTPCTQRNILKDNTVIQTLLKNIPGLEIHTIESIHACCGAAGTHMLTHPDTANTLRGPIVQEVQRIKPDIVVTNNIGCQLHIQAGLKQSGVDIPVLHPIALLNQQLA